MQVIAISIIYLKPIAIASYIASYRGHASKWFS